MTGNDVLRIKLYLIADVEGRGRGTTSVDILLITMLSSRHLSPKMISNVPKVLSDGPSCFSFVTSSSLGWVEGLVRVVFVVDEEREHFDNL